MGLAAAFAFGDAASLLGIWKTCLEGPEVRGLGWATFALFGRHGGLLMPSKISAKKFQGFGIGAGCRRRPWRCCILVGDMDHLLESGGRLPGRVPGLPGRSLPAVGASKLLVAGLPD